MKKPQRSEPDMERFRYKGDLRTAGGHMPCDQWGNYFSLGQGELHHHPAYMAGGAGRYGGCRSIGIDFSVGLLALNNGKWLARPTREVLSYTVNSRQYDSRVHALRHAVAKVVRMARRRARYDWRKVPGYGCFKWDPNPDFKMSVEEAQSVIAWAFGLLNLPAPTLHVAPPAPPPIAIDGRLNLEGRRP